MERRAPVTEPGRFLISWPRVAVGLALFAALATLGAFAAGWRDGGPALLARGPAIPPGYAAGALALVAADFLLGGLRLHLWLRRFRAEAPYRLALRTYLVNLFAAALSPLGAASGPAQLATLVRGGVPATQAAAALLLNYVGILSGLLLVGGLAAGYLATRGAWVGRLDGLHAVLLVAAAALPALLVPAILNPGWGGALGDRLAAWGARLGGRAGAALGRAGAAARRAVDQYAQAARSVRERGGRTLAAGTALSGAMVLNKSAIGLLLAAGLGFGGPWLEVLARQAVQGFLLYFSPSPGGSGIAEASVPLFMGGVLPEGRWMEFAVLWRAATSYVGVATGAVAAALVFAARRPYAPAETATRSARCERDRSTQLTRPNSGGTKSGRGVEPG